MDVGVAINASIVPLSHSLAMTNAVSKIPISVITTLMEPGSKK